MKILSFGAGMQSTALALMSCENAFAKTDGKELPHPLVPIYDIVIFCDLGWSRYGYASRRILSAEPVKRQESGIKNWMRPCTRI